jgi:hypothetical protein
MIKEKFLIFMAPKSPLKGLEGAQSAPPQAPKIPPAKAQEQVKVKGELDRARQSVEQAVQAPRKGMAEIITANVNPYLTIPGMNLDKMDAAKKSLKEALAFIKKKLSGAKLPVNININFKKDEYKDEDAAIYLPLMIKESNLDNSLTSQKGAIGYFQLMNSALADVNQKFEALLGKDFVKKDTKDMKDPLANCVYGILYFHLCQDHYAKQPPFNTLTAQEQKLIGYMSYNKGPSHPKKLWEKAGKKNFADFEKFLAGELAKQLGIKSGDPVKKLDANFNVDYSEFPAVTKYLELLTNKDPKLGDPFRLKNKKGEYENTGVNLGQVGETLRYARVIERLDEMKTVESGDSIPNLRRTEKLKPGKYELWGMAEKLRIEMCGTKKVLQDECNNSEKDLRDRNSFRSVLMKILLIFNKIYNPKFGNINIEKVSQDLDDEKGGLFPKAIDILVPDDEFIAKNYNLLIQEGEAKAEEVVRQESEPEIIALKKQLPVYASTKLKDRVGEKLTFDAKKDKFDVDRTFAVVPERGERKPGATKYIILHSTNDETADAFFVGTKNKKTGKIEKSTKIHYVVTRDGIIHEISQRDHAVNHAGYYAHPSTPAIWDGDVDLAESSVGIEVAASNGTDWEPKQYESVRKLIHWLGAIYDIPVNGVLAHKQVANTASGTRGRKGDPYILNWGLLGLPDNYQLIDTDVVIGRLRSNLEDIKKGMAGKCTNKNAWCKQKPEVVSGLEKSEALAKDEQYKDLVKKIRQESLKAWKAQIEETHNIISYTVKKKDTFTRIARAHHVPAQTIMRYNDLRVDQLAIGQILKIPQPK